MRAALRCAGALYPGIECSGAQLVPSFVHPVFESDDGSLWFQKHAEDRIVEFVEAACDRSRLHPVDSPPIDVRLGDPALFGFYFGNNRLLVTQRDQLVSHLLQAREVITLYPIIGSEIARFVKSINGYRNALNACQHKYGSATSFQVSRLAQSELVERVDQEHRSHYLQQQLELEKAATRISFLTPTVTNALTPAPLLTSKHLNMATDVRNAMIRRAENLLYLITNRRVDVDVFFWQKVTLGEERREYILKLVGNHSNLRIHPLPTLVGDVPPCALVETSGEPIPNYIAYSSQAGMTPAAEGRLESASAALEKAIHARDIAIAQSRYDPMMPTQTLE